MCTLASSSALRKEKNIVNGYIVTRWVLLLPRLTSQSVWVIDAANRTAPEDHLVFCECPRLVREDILNLPKVLTDVESTALKWTVCGGIVHLLVPVDKVDLNELDNLYRDIERDWNNDLYMRECAYKLVILGLSSQLKLVPPHVLFTLEQLAVAYCTLTQCT